MLIIEQQHEKAESVANGNAMWTDGRLLQSVGDRQWKNLGKNIIVSVKFVLLCFPQSGLRLKLRTFQELVKFGKRVCKPFIWGGQGCHVNPK